MCHTRYRFCAHQWILQMSHWTYMHVLYIIRSRTFAEISTICLVTLNTDLKNIKNVKGTPKIVKCFSHYRIYCYFLETYKTWQPSFIYQKKHNNHSNVHNNFRNDRYIIINFMKETIYPYPKITCFSTFRRMWLWKLI